MFKFLCTLGMHKLPVASFAPYQVGHIEVCTRCGGRFQLRTWDNSFYLEHVWVRRPELH